MDIQYQTDLEGICAEHLAHFCVGWQHPICGNEMYTILENSYSIVLAKDGNRVIGFINALSDGLKFAFIPMLEVLPEYQKRGIGTKLFNILLKSLGDIPNIDLTCEETLQRYYERFGMLKSYGMVFRK